ncbi:hypothetical protein SCUP234_06044 [Seiridium cupressi]
MLKAKFACKRASALAVKPIRNSDTVRVFVGKESREFVFSKKALTSTSIYFASRLDASGLNFLQRNAQLNTLWLEDLCPDMFELFEYWVNLRHSTGNTRGISFQPFIDEAHLQDCCEDLHWDLTNLHLFAARIGLDALQDAAMDALQDIYLRCDWDITPRFVAQLYTETDPAESYRLRKWIVAMTAWSLNGSPGGGLDSGAGEKMQALFEMVPDFQHDYAAHMDKSSKSRVKLQFKNPQLRLPSNNLRNDERQFGFRQCSFHTHRSSVGQGRCPHTLARVPSLTGSSLLDVEDVESDHSDSELFGHITGTALVSSPRTAIFDLYLDIH